MAKRVFRIVLFLLVGTGLAYVAWRLAPGRGTNGVGTTLADSTAVGVRAASLYYGNEEGERWVVESREIVERDGLHAQASALLEALAEGPRGPGVATVPAATKLSHAYALEGGELVLDLSKDFVQGLAGGSRTEEVAVGSIVRTMAANLPNVRRVRIVCQGPLVSAGGHVPLDRPLDPLDWP